VDLFLAASQGTGIALATGVRPFLPVLLAGVLARADLGVDFEGTDFAFLESLPFLAALVVIGIVLEAVAWRDTGTLAAPLIATVGSVAVVLGALEFGGSLADEEYAAGPGLIAGAVCAALGYVAARAFFGGAEARLADRSDLEPVTFLRLYVHAAALVLAALAVLAPPVSYLALGACLWLLWGRRRRAGRKYEGLRLLR